MGLEKKSVNILIKYVFCVTSLQRGWTAQIRASLVNLHVLCLSCLNNFWAPCSHTGVYMAYIYIYGTKNYPSKIPCVKSSYTCHVAHKRVAIISALSWRSFLSSCSQFQSETGKTSRSENRNRMTGKTAGPGLELCDATSSSP